MAMRYYFNKTLSTSFDDALSRVSEELQQEGFGILTEIDVRAKVREKLGEEFRNYRILGACNPSFAWQALQIEDKIGTLLPCNVIIQELAPDKIEVAAIDPAVSMLAVDNPALRDIVTQVRAKLQKVIDSL
jgi:uncharacterized protein (DUF302 family)